MYKRQPGEEQRQPDARVGEQLQARRPFEQREVPARVLEDCLLYTSDAADERSSVDLGGRRIIKKKNEWWID